MCGCRIANWSSDVCSSELRAVEIGQRMGGQPVEADRLDKRYSIVPYQTTHNTGGAIMGEDPRTSVVNRYLQSWEVPNLFVMGACVYPQNPGYNPTGTVGALAYRALDTLLPDYLTNPRPDRKSTRLNSS